MSLCEIWPKYCNAVKFSAESVMKKLFKKTKYCECNRNKKNKQNINKILSIGHQCIRKLPNDDILMYCLNDDSQFSGECKILRDNKLILRCQWDNNGKLHGKYCIYYPNSNVRTTGNVLNGYLKLINNKWNVMGNHVGEHKKNYKNNKVLRRFSLDNGVRNGRYTSYHENGNEKSKVESKKQNENGEWK